MLLAWSTPALLFLICLYLRRMWLQRMPPKKTDEPDLRTAVEFARYHRKKRRRRIVKWCFALLPLPAVAVTVLVIGPATVQREILRLFYETTGKPEIVVESVQKDVAVHEAGHAVVAAIVQPEERLKEIVVYAQLNSGVFGYVSHQRRNQLRTRSEILAESATFMGGRAAEVVILKDATEGAGSDLAHVTNDVTSMYTRSGLGSSLRVKSDVSADDQKKIDQDIIDTNKRSEKIVENNRETLQALADLVMEQPVDRGKRRLTGKQFCEFIEQRKLLDENGKDVAPRKCETSDEMANDELKHERVILDVRPSPH